MKGQSERKLLIPISRRKKTFVLPLVVYGWIFLISLLALILFYVSIYYSSGKDNLNGKPRIDNLIGITNSFKHGQQIIENKKLGLSHDMNTKETLIVSMQNHGDIHIVLRPDLSSESVAYIREMAKLPSCPNCNFYRADERILQGIIKSDNVKKIEKKGICPTEFRQEKQPDCPQWDPNCGCHGPTMTKGMVGWAGGGTGQDFFIESYKEPAKWWGQQHTVWGEIQDLKSHEVIDAIFKLPTHKKGMVYLNDKIPFEIKIV